MSYLEARSYSILNDERDLEIPCLETGSYSVTGGSLLAIFNCLRYVLFWVIFFLISSNALYFFQAFEHSANRFSTVLYVDWFLAVKGVLRSINT